MARGWIPGSLGHDAAPLRVLVQRGPPGRGVSCPFRYHFCQREAIETLAYVVEVFGKRDSKELIQSFGDIRQKDLR